MKGADSLCDLWDTIKCTDVTLIGVPEGEKKRTQSLFKEVTTENILNLRRDLAIQVHKANRLPSHLNANKNLP